MSSVLDLGDLDIGIQIGMSILEVKADKSRLNWNGSASSTQYGSPEVMSASCGLFGCM